MRARSVAVLVLAAALASAAHALDVVEVWQAARTHDPEHAAALAAHDAGGAHRTQAGLDGLHQLAAARGTGGRIEAAVEHEAHTFALNGPDVVVKRHGTVVLVAADEVVAGRAGQVRIAHGADFIDGLHRSMLAVTALPRNHRKRS